MQIFNQSCLKIEINQLKKNPIFHSLNFKIDILNKLKLMKKINELNL